jgi:hypothetical protein
VQEVDLLSAPDAIMLVEGRELPVTLLRSEESRGRLWKLELSLETDGRSELAEYYYVIKW